MAGTHNNISITVSTFNPNGLKDWVYESHSGLAPICPACKGGFLRNWSQQSGQVATCPFCEFAQANPQLLPAQEECEAILALPEGVATEAHLEWAQAYRRPDSILRVKKTSGVAWRDLRRNPNLTDEDCKVFVRIEAELKLRHRQKLVASAYQLDGGGEKYPSGMEGTALEDAEAEIDSRSGPHESAVVGYCRQLGEEVGDPQDFKEVRVAFRAGDADHAPGWAWVALWGSPGKTLTASSKSAAARAATASLSGLPR